VAPEAEMDLILTDIFEQLAGVMKKLEAIPKS
jgi:hypothetical protein